MKLFYLFLCNAPATTEIYTLSLHDALPISNLDPVRPRLGSMLHEKELAGHAVRITFHHHRPIDEMGQQQRSEEHTSELQSHSDLVCRLLLEKKKRINEGRMGSGGRSRTELK